MTPYDPLSEDLDKADRERYAEYLDEQDRDRKFDHAPAPDFTPRTLDECVERLERACDMAEELAADVERRLARMLEGLR